jgi:O-antigen/teichoic acid export membrane protein
MTQVLFVATLPNAIAMVLTSGVMAAGRPGLATRAQLSAAVVTVVALLLLVPALGAIGAAYASLLAYTMAGILVSLGFVRVSRLGPREFLVPRQSDLVQIVTRIKGQLTSR